jgi:hypothetical protein
MFLGVGNTVVDLILTAIPNLDRVATCNSPLRTRSRVLALLGLSLFAAIEEKNFGVSPYNLVPFFI